MADELVFNMDYPDEAEMVLMAEWVQKLSVPVPRLKPEYRSVPNAPWSPSEKAETQLEERNKLMQKAIAEEERQRQ